MLDWETLIYMQRNIQPFNIVVLQDSPLTPKLLQNKTDMRCVNMVEKMSGGHLVSWSHVSLFNCTICELEGVEFHPSWREHVINIGVMRGYFILAGENMLLRDAASRRCSLVAGGPTRSHFLLPHSKPPLLLPSTPWYLILGCCNFTIEPHTKPPLLLLST